MTNTPQATGGLTQARPNNSDRKNRRRAPTAQQSKAAAVMPANTEKITMLEIASWEAGRKTLSLSARISMATALKLLAVASEESKV